MRKCFLLISCVLMPGLLAAQTNDIPDIPVIEGYKGNEGAIIKYNSFNFLTLKNEEGSQSRQSTGQYWEVSYTYDSAFRQKEKFAEFMTRQIREKGGSTFFADTASIHFAVPDSGGNLWGKVILSSNSLYKLRLVKEKAFENTVKFDSGQMPEFDEFVTPVELPPRLGYLPNSVVTRIEVSKFNHYSFSYSDEEKGTFRQNLMGPYWDLKLEIQDENGEVDKRISYVEILESYYRAVIQSDGKIIKNRAREIVFSLPLEENTLWVRLMVTMDGIYFLKIIEQSPQDFTEAELVYPKTVNDSLPSQDR